MSTRWDQVDIGGDSMQKCKGCGAPSVGEYCPRCLRETRPDLAGTVRRGGPVATSQPPTKRPPVIGFEPETASPSSGHRRKPPCPLDPASVPAATPSPSSGHEDRAACPLAPADVSGETLSAPLHLRVTPAMLDRLETLAASMSTALPALVRQILTAYLDAHTPHD